MKVKEKLFNFIKIVEINKMTIDKYKGECTLNGEKIPYIDEWERYNKISYDKINNIIEYPIIINPHLKGDMIVGNVITESLVWYHTSKIKVIEFCHAGAKVTFLNGLEYTLKRMPGLKNDL